MVGAFSVERIERMTGKIVNTNIRFDLMREPDRRAWEYLQQMDRNKHKSYTKAVITALVDYFEKEEAVLDDPYLETREKEDAFLMRIEKAVADEIARSSEGIVRSQHMENAYEELRKAMEKEQEDLK